MRSFDLAGGKTVYARIPHDGAQLLEAVTVQRRVGDSDEWVVITADGREFTRKASQLQPEAVKERRTLKSAYQHAVFWIAHNDSPGDADALEVETVQGLTTVALISDMFDVEPRKLAEAIVEQRRRDFGTSR